MPDDEQLHVELAAEDPTVLVVHCSERAMRAAVDEILFAHHREEPVERVSVPGGAWWVARAAGATRGRVRRWVAGRLADAVDEAVDRMMSRQSLRCIELLGHEGCSWYERVNRRATAGELVRLQGEDLYLAAEELARWSRLRVAGRIVLDRPGGAVVRTLFG